MEFMLPLIAVKDLRISRHFYEHVLCQKVSLDLGETVTFEGRFTIQEDYEALLDIDELSIRYRGNDHELYFEEEDFDAFRMHIRQYEDILYLHEVKECSCGQKLVRFYDPDFHIIAVAEMMDSVFRRFHSKGLSVEDIAKKTKRSEEYIRQSLGC